MGELEKKFDSATKALRTFEEVLGEPYSKIVRDAAIQRFEYSFEISWKTLQTYLKEKEGIVANSPKSAFREALPTDILSANEVELALKMTDDRNLTTHTYHEEVAQQIFESLSDYFGLLKNCSIK